MLLWNNSDIQTVKYIYIFLRVTKMKTRSHLLIIYINISTEINLSYHGSRHLRTVFRFICMVQVKWWSGLLARLTSAHGVEYKPLLRWYCFGLKNINIDPYLNPGFITITSDSHISQTTTPSTFYSVLACLRQLISLHTNQTKMIVNTRRNLYCSPGRNSHASLSCGKYKMAMSATC